MTTAADNLDSVERVVLSALAHYSEVSAAYIFGSVAKGQTHPGSDVDIAVLVADEAVKSNSLEFRLKLIEEVTSALGRSDVDVVFLNEARPLLAHRVLRDGKLILERSASARVRFQIHTVNRYFDTQPMRDFYLAQLKKDVQEGRISG